MRSRTWASHAAHLDDMTGIGLLVIPNADSDLSTGGPHTLHSAGQDKAIDDLRAEGWEPLADEYGGLFYDKRTTLSGDRVVSLWSHAPIISRPTLEEESRAMVELATACGLPSAAGGGA